MSPEFNQIYSVNRTRRIPIEDESDAGEDRKTLYEIDTAPSGVYVIGCATVAIVRRRMFLAAMHVGPVHTNSSRDAEATLTYIRRGQDHMVQEKALALRRTISCSSNLDCIADGSHDRREKRMLLASSTRYIQIPEFLIV